jgi:predicted deacylase
LVNGKADGPTVVLNGATHPVELAGIGVTQIVTRKRLDPLRLSGRVVAFPVTNPFGYQFGEYISPHDSLNMMVAYPGSKDGSVTSRFANFIWEHAAKNADLVIDLHENVKPALQFILLGKSDDSIVESKALSLAKAFGLTIARPGKEELSLIGMRPGDLGYYQLCMANGIPSFMPELESSTDIEFNEQYNAVRVGVRGVMNCLKKLGMISGNIEPQSDTKVLQGSFAFYQTIPANRGGIVNRLAEIGVKIPKGAPIANVTNSYGEVIETLTMPVDGCLFGWNLGAPPYYNWGVHSGDGVAYVYVEE